MPSFSNVFHPAGGLPFPSAPDAQGTPTFPDGFSTLVVEQSSDCVTFSDAAGLLLYVNAAGRRMLGIAPDEAVRGTHFADYLSPESGALCVETVLPTAARFGRWEGEMDLVNRVTGGHVPVHRSVIAMRDGDERLAGFAAMSRDLSVQKAAERALIDSRERLEFALRAANMIAWEWEPVADRVAHTRSTDLSQARTITDRRDFLAMIHPEDRDAVQATFERCFEQGTDYRIEYRLTGEGDPIWIQSVGRAVVEADGRKRMRGIMQDVTARIGSERALKASEERLAQQFAELEALYESAPVGLAVLDADLRFVRINRLLAEINGIPAEAHIGRTVREVVPDLAPKADATLRAILETGQPVFNMELTGETAAAPGVTRAWRENWVPLFDAEHRVIGISIAAIETTESKRVADELLSLTAELEARVEQRTRALRHANAQLAAEIERREAAQAALVQSQKLEALGQLTSGVAHDFNNIIAAISGGFRVVQRRTDDPTLAEVARHGADAAERGAALVSQLLSFAREQVLEPTTVSLAALLEECSVMIRQSAGPEVTVEIDVPADLPAVRIDPVRLEATLVNLTVNARDAMSGKGRLHIRARLADPADLDRPPELNGIDAVELCVTDTGCGMDADTLRRATEPFFTTKPPGKGTGLGLAMVHGFLQQSGGALRLSSTPGEGTTFRLYLPKEAGSPMIRAKSRAPQEARARHPARLLLVDDDDAVRAVTAAVLHDVGHEVHQAGNAVAALAALDEGAFDAVVTDVALPEMDGLDLARDIRARGLDVPILFVSGNADHDRLRGEAVLDKPFTHDSLARKLDELLAGRPPAHRRAAECR